MIWPKCCTKLRSTANPPTVAQHEHDVRGLIREGFLAKKLVKVEIVPTRLGTIPTWTVFFARLPLIGHQFCRGGPFLEAWPRINSC